ncbi:unnamed protein product, partial [Staurois parvus]
MYIEKWGKDLGIEIDEDKQRKIYRHTHENISMREVEVNYKCLVRWHITPSVEHKIDVERTQECWQGCGKFGTWFHIWWECPKIQSFWETIVNLIRKISGIKIGLDPEACLLH